MKQLELFDNEEYFDIKEAKNIFILYYKRQLAKVEIN